MVVWLMQTGADGAAFALFLLAGLSDAADGYIAKRWNMTSQLGAYLDPLADKLLIVAILVELASAGGLPLWIVAVVLARDAFIVAAIAASWSLGRAIAIHPLIVSKLTTAAQIALAATVLADRAFAVDLAVPTAAVMWLTAVLTLLSGAAYAQAWWRHMMRIDETRAATGNGGELAPGQRVTASADELRAAALHNFDRGVQTSHRSADLKS